MLGSNQDLFMFVEIVKARCDIFSLLPLLLRENQDVQMAAVSQRGRLLGACRRVSRVIRKAVHCGQQENI